MSASYQKPVTQTPATFDFVATTAQTAVDLLANHTGLSKQRIKDAMNKGAVWWTQKGKQLRLRRATKVVPAGTRIQCFYDEQILAREPEPPQLIAQLPDYGVWYKPHGLLSQGSQWGDHCSLLRWVEIARQKACFLVHRLDADAAGLIIIAHTSSAAAKLSMLFQSREMRKIYEAQVKGLLALGADGLNIDQPLDGKSANSQVYTMKLFPTRQMTHVQVNIGTGRKHQIRRHLASIGHPIIGDRLYGTADKLPLQLVAVELAYQCPLTHKALTFQLPPELRLKKITDE